MLSEYRVLDLTDERGQLAGMMLADLGAEVILVESPTGSRSRAVGPFVEGREDDPEASLWFWSYNRGKRSITLDLDSDEGQSQIKALVEGADVVIESSDVGTMARRGLSYEELSAVNPQLVFTSISAYGQTGPKATWGATDLTVAAAGMQMNLQGDDDRAPLRIPLDQSFLHASAEAGAATLIALHERNRSGLGQHVDVSAQQALTCATQSTSLAHLYNSPDAGRMSGGAKLGPFKIRLRSPAADGYVSTTILFGEAVGPFGQRLFEWIHEEGECEDSDLEIEWIDFVAGVMSGQIPMGEYDRIQDVAAEFTSKRQKQDLLREALARRLLIVPVANVGDVAEEAHYAERDFWREIDVPGHGVVSFPGPSAKLSATPMTIDSPPPVLGEANDEFGAETARELPTQVAKTPSDGTALPLSDVNVLDLQWVMAGPASTRVLADWGATVVRVESSNKVETARTIQPFLNDEGGADNGGLYQNMNAGKLGLALDMSKPESKGVIEDLVKWADVVCESFSPKAMQTWGLGYEDLKKINPSIIMTSSCLFGQDGPLSSLAGFGTMGASMSGFYAMTGWPDREPAGVMGAYTDYVSPRFLTAAILAALDHRDRTGEGQYIDLSQAEAAMHFLTPAVLDYRINNRQPEPMGNDHPSMFPHGNYPAAGEDKWVAIVCQDDDQWAAACQLMSLPEHLVDLGAEQRREQREEIDNEISAWTAQRSGADAQDLLQEAGVTAHRLQMSEALAEDPQLEHRRHFRHVDHMTNEKMWVEGTRFAMSRSSDDITDAGPSYGQHTFEVLEGILGYDADRVAELAVASVLE
ncbi:MAG TPA: CoA transferase [Acidimicrobiales bacterium]|nr:CoA transferase [Acidimicrobiales bacterium]